MHQEYRPVLTYSAFYPKNKLPEKNLDNLNGLDRDMIIKLLCRIKMTLSKTEPNVIYPFINWFFSRLPELHQKKIGQFLDKGFMLLSLTTPLIINQILVDLLNQVTYPPIPEYERTDRITLAILDTMLIYNDHHFRTVLMDGRKDEHDLLWELMLLQDINGKNQMSFARSGAIKQAIFLDYIKDVLQEHYNDYERQICDKLRISGFVKIALMYIGLQIEQEAKLKSTDPLIAIPPDSELYMLLEKLELVCKVNEQFPEFTIGGLMMQPFIPLSNNYLSFSGTHDLGLISERIWANYLFKDGTIKTLVPKIAKGGFPSFFGNYVEKFLLGRIFSSLDQTGLRVILSDDLKTPDITLILNETDIFLIEIKSSSLHYKDWENQDLVRFKKYLDENFIGDRKGVIQIHKCMQHLADSPEKLYGLRTKLSKLKIYPVIVYTEAHATTVAVNDYIIENAPAIPSELAKRFNRVHPVTMIDHEFFLENIKLLREKKRLLKDAIIHYHKGMALRKKIWQKVNTTFNFSKAMESFDIYSIGYEGIYKANQNDIAKELKVIFDRDTNLK